MELFTGLLPSVIWSGIIGSLIGSCLTILGVFLTNRGHEKRQAALLDHEKQKYKSEQQLALKKEVFLNVAKSFADVLGVITKLTNLDFTQKEIEAQISDHSGIVAKAYLAAKEDSVAAILSYSADTAEALIKLMDERAVILGYKKEIEIYQSIIDSAISEKNRIFSMMANLNPQGINSQATFDYLNKSYEAQENIFTQNTANAEEERLIMQPLYLSFAKKCIQEHSRLLSLLPPMVTALRGELENDQNPQIFIDALNKNIERMNVAFAKLFEQEETDDITK